MLAIIQVTFVTGTFTQRPKQWVQQGHDCSALAAGQGQASLSDYSGQGHHHISDDATQQA
jgi:hypothetical protein